MIISLIGPPGAGKTTQAARLSARLGVQHVSTGAMLRTAIRRGTSEGVAARRYIESGRLPPDDVIIPMLRRRINEDDCRPGFVLDGFPRNVSQALALEESLAASNARLDAAILLDVRVSTSRDRVTARRSQVTDLQGESVLSTSSTPRVPDEPRVDDQPQALHRRITGYYAQSIALARFYETRALLCRVDGEGPPEIVMERLLELVRRPQ